MRIEKLTTNFQTALADAQSLAVGRDHQFVEPIHVMRALLDQSGGSVYHLLSKAGVNLTKLDTELNKILDQLPQVKGRGRCWGSSYLQ